MGEGCLDILGPPQASGLLPHQRQDPDWIQSSREIGRELTARLEQDVADGSVGELLPQGSDLLDVIERFGEVFVALRLGGQLAVLAVALGLLGREVVQQKRARILVCHGATVAVVADVPKRFACLSFKRVTRAPSVTGAWP